LHTPVCAPSNTSTHIRDLPAAIETHCAPHSILYCIQHKQLCCNAHTHTTLMTILRHTLGGSYCFQILIGYNLTPNLLLLIVWQRAHIHRRCIAYSEIHTHTHIHTRTSQCFRSQHNAIHSIQHCIGYIRCLRACRPWGAHHGVHHTCQNHRLAHEVAGLRTCNADCGNLCTHKLI
jgi:hypothetical protein